MSSLSKPDKCAEISVLSDIAKLVCTLADIPEKPHVRAPKSTVKAYVMSVWG